MGSHKNDRGWHPGRIYEAWDEIHRALNQTMATLPNETLAFLSERAYDRIIRDAAADALNAHADAATATELRHTFHKNEDDAAQGEDDPQASSFEQALAEAKASNQISIWDRTERPWAIAVYDEPTRRLHPLTDEQAATVLNRDPVISTEWIKWSRMTGNAGSLIVLDAERVRRVLSKVDDERGGEESAR